MCAVSGSALQESFCHQALDDCAHGRARDAELLGEHRVFQLLTGLNVSVEEHCAQLRLSGVGDAHRLDGTLGSAEELVGATSPLILQLGWSAHETPFTHTARSEERRAGRASTAWGARGAREGTES